jgi:hypothetical protein
MRKSDFDFERMYVEQVKRAEYMEKERAKNEQK